MFKSILAKAPVSFTIVMLLGFLAIYLFLDTSEILKEQPSNRFTGKSLYPDNLYETPERRRRLPKALIIGFNKCGTSTLRSFLTIHPDIVSPKREVRFFNEHYSKGLEWYRLQMPMSKPYQITIEKTPGYIKTPEIMKRIHAFDPEVKLLVIVRNPLTRLQSLYAHNMHYLRESERVSIETWLKHDSKSFIPRVSQAANFAEPILEAFAIFPREQFLILSEEELEADPSSIIQKVQSFLNLRPVNTNNLFVFDKKKGFYCVNTTNPLFRETDIINQVNVTDGCMRGGKGREHPDISDDVRKEIVEITRPCVQNLFRLISKAFKWDDY